MARASVCQTFADVHFTRLKADGIAFPVELFIMHAVDADGSIRSELGAAEEWVGKVKVVTDVVSREIRILEKAISQMDRQTKEEILQIKHQGNETQAKLNELLLAVARLANKPSPQ